MTAKLRKPVVRVAEADPGDVFDVVRVVYPRHGGTCNPPGPTVCPTCGLSQYWWFKPDGQRRRIRAPGPGDCACP